MKKSVVITGDRGSGKSKEAKEIASYYKPEEVVYISLRKYFSEDVFLFSECTPKTKLIVCDGIRKTEDITWFYDKIGTDLKINRKGKPSFNISVDFVLECDEDITPNQLTALGESFGKRFVIINCVKAPFKLENVPQKTEVIFIDDMEGNIDFNYFSELSKEANKTNR